MILSFSDNRCDCNIRSRDKIVRLHSNYKTLSFLKLLHTRQCCNLAKMAFSSSSSTEVVAFDTDLQNIIIDSGATAAFTHCLQDFTSFTPMDSALQGLGTLKIKGIGTVEYLIFTNKNVLTKLTIHGAYYVPSLNTHLLSPQQVCQQYRSVYEGGTIFFKLRWKEYCKTIPITKQNNLPILHTASGNTLAQNVHSHICKAAHSDVLAFKIEKVIPQYDLQPELSSDHHDEELEATSPTLDTTVTTSTKKKYRVQCHNKQCSNCNKITTDDSDNKINMKELTTLSKDQIDFLHLHKRWDHMSFHIMKSLARCGIIKKRFSTTTSPFCLSCKLGKAHQLTRNKDNSIVPETILKPGDLIHTDQAESATPGCTMTISGYNNNQKILVFTLFIDSISKKIFVEFQSSTSAAQTLVGKHRLERTAAEFNVTIKNDHADNSVFKSK